MHLTQSVAVDVDHVDWYNVAIKTQLLDEVPREVEVVSAKEIWKQDQIDVAIRLEIALSVGVLLLELYLTSW